MHRRTPLALALSACCALLLLACGGADNANTTNTTNAANANRTAATTTASPAAAATSAASTTAAAAGDKIGVAECDDFLTKYDDCVTKHVPEAARAQYKAGLEQWRKSWRDLAANPQTRPSLVQACKQSAETAKQSMAAYNCSF